MARQGKFLILLEDAVANGAAAPINVSPYDTLVVELSTSNSADGLITFLGSISPTVPDFESNASFANPYAGVRMLDLDTGVGISGVTGIDPGGVDITTKLYKVNVDHLKWFTALISGWSSGNFNVRVYAMARERLR